MALIRSNCSPQDGQPVLRLRSDWRLAKGRSPLPSGTAVDAEVDLCNTSGSYFLQARLNVSLPGLESEVAEALVHTAHQTCPYSKVTRGNINLVINLV